MAKSPPLTPKACEAPAPRCPPGTRLQSAGGSLDRASGARAPRAPPALPPAPLTLDLLVDHQGEVVHLQDAREHAQRVSQADLEERPRSALTRPSAESSATEPELFGQHVLLGSLLVTGEGGGTAGTT